MKFVPFVEEMLEDAALLLSRRHQYDRNNSKCLPIEFEDSTYALEVIKELFGRRDTEGLAVVEKHELLGFIMYRYKIDLQRERQVWIDYEGFSICSQEHLSLYRFMYAELAKKWVEKGYFQHYIVLPAENSEIDAWLKLGFGYEQAYAINDLSNLKLNKTSNKGIVIRKATEADQKDVRNMATIILKHQASSPTFSPLFPEDKERLQEGYSKLISDPNVDLWLAFENEEVIGFQAIWPVNSDETKYKSMLIPYQSMELGISGIVEGHRGKGIGRLLTYTALTEVKERGYQYVVTDWRVTNLLSSSFWPNQGFKETAYRLSRVIDSRVAWAK